MSTKPPEKYPLSSSSRNTAEKAARQIFSAGRCFLYSVFSISLFQRAGRTLAALPVFENLPVKPLCKGFVSLLGEVNTVIGSGNAPEPGIGKPNPQPRRQLSVKHGEAGRVCRQTFLLNPLPKGHGRRSHQQNFLPLEVKPREELFHPFRRSLGRTALEQVVGA